MNKEQIQSQKKVKQYVPLIQEQIALCNDMALSVQENYNSKKIHPFRELCLGYLLICKENMKASICLLEAGIIHQMNFISRNMCEMALTVCYINDDKHKQDERITRYFEYNNSVLKYKAIKNLSKYEDIFGKLQINDVSEEIIKNYNTFKKKYGKGSNNALNENSWSGMNLPDMIEAISNKELKRELFQLYHIMVQYNNHYLHPTRLYINSAIKDFFSGEVNHRIAIVHLHIISALVYLIADKYLEQFSKQRPEFRKRNDDISNKLMEIAKNIDIDN